jgi:hypothetical protein
MIPVHHPACNDVLRRPAGVPASECSDLPIIRTKDGVTSLWRVSPQELTAIAEGRPIALSFVSATHPPVSLYVAGDIATDHLQPGYHLVQDPTLRARLQRAIQKRHTENTESDAVRALFRDPTHPEWSGAMKHLLGSLTAAICLADLAGITPEEMLARWVTAMEAKHPDLLTH